MTEVLSSKHYGHDDMDFTPRRSSSAIDSDSIVGTSSSPLVISSKLVDESICEVENIDREHLLGEHCRDEAEPEFDEIDESERKRAQLSLLALLLAAFRRTGLTCQAPQEEIKMDIGWPTDVRHVTHVTFDRFNGFLGLPVEFELEIPRRVPSASASVFGVSAESMQCSYDRKGNSVPTILLLMQDRLYEQGGLQAEGIFRINAENSQEEHVRNQLNKGIVPHDIDVHCLAGLIKAWFRELPRGVLDSLSPDQVLQCHTEEQCVKLAKLLPPTQGALLDWAVNLMADVVQEEEFNKMNARNIAMVFAPNMTQMSDPLTALMHAVQVMNFLKALILKVLRDREEAALDPKPASSCAEPPNGSGNGHTTQGPCLVLCRQWDKTEEHMNTTRAFSMKGSTPRGRSKEEDSTEDFDETFSTTSSVKETTDGDEIFCKHGCPISKMSNTIDDIDDNDDDDDESTSLQLLSNAQEALSIGNQGRSCAGGHKGRDVLKYSLNFNDERDGTSRAVYALNNNTTKHPAKGLSRKGRIDSRKVDNENSESNDSMQCGAIVNLPAKGKVRGGRLVGKINQQSERAEAW